MPTPELTADADDARMLAELEPTALAERLMDLARDAKVSFAEDDREALHQMVRLLARAAGLARHQARDLIELAESFVRALAGPNFSERDLKVRAFVREFGIQGEEVLALLLRRPVRSDEVERYEPALREALAMLAKQGVLVRALNWAIAPSMVSSVRDLVSPPIFRMWTKVEVARRQASMMREGEAALLIASGTGVTLQQAQRFLTGFPLPNTIRREIAPRSGVISATDVAGQGAMPAQDSKIWGLVGDTGDAPWVPRRSLQEN
jgi:hypothetical protein